MVGVVTRLRSWRSLGVPDDHDVACRRAACIFERYRPHDVEVEAVAFVEIEALFADKDRELSLQEAISEVWVGT